MVAVSPDAFIKRKIRKDTMLVNVADYNRFVPFYAFCTVCQHTLTANDVLAPITQLMGASGLEPIPGFGAIYRLTSDGVHSPSFSPSFKKSTSSGDYDLTLGKVNLITFLFDGVDYWYSINQAQEVQV